MVQPETVIRWHREGFRRYWCWKSRRRAGQPSTMAETRALVRRMAAENPTWGAPRIHGEIQKLGLEVSERTVSRTMPRRPINPDQRQRWRTFLANHREVIAAIDFFTVPTATFRVFYVFFVVHHSRRELMHFRDRGRDAGCPAPPAQIPACAANAPGSYLGSWRRSVVAASRTRSSVWDTSLLRLCVRDVVC